MRIVIAEDDTLLREGLTHLLRAEGLDVTSAVDTPDDLLSAIATDRPDVAVVDVRMPPTFRDEGLRAAVEARAKWPGLAVLVLSAHVEESYATQLLADGSGGVGYLLKERVGKVADFLDALNRVAAGGTAMDPEVVAQLLVRRRADDPLRHLTPREREVMEGVVAGKPNKIIAAELGTCEQTVKVHRGRVMEKMGADSLADLVRVADRIGALKKLAISKAG